MPTRRRIPTLQEQTVNPLRAFRGPSGDGTDVWFDDAPAYRTQQEARRAWRVHRRLVWAHECRFRIPSPAQIYDGLSLQSVEVLRSVWGYWTFELEPVLEAIDADRAALAAFVERDPRGAKDIADYLDVLREDLNTIETTARHLATVPAGKHFEHAPHHLSTGCTYGGTNYAGGF